MGQPGTINKNIYSNQEKPTIFYRKYPSFPPEEKSFLNLPQKIIF